MIRESIGRPAAHHLTVWFVAASTFIPVAIDLAVSDQRRAFGYVAADTFYYLTVAENAASGHGLSFDQERLTNGYHPLWQLLLIATRLLSGGPPNSGQQVLLSVVLGLALVSAFVVMFGYAIASSHKRIGPAFLLLPVGAYALALSPNWWSWARGIETLYPRNGATPLPGTLWSFVNGMESGLVLFFFGLTAWWCCCRSGYANRPGAILLGLMLSGITLARLDHIFFPLALLGTLVGGRILARDWATLQRLSWATAAFAAPVGAYLLTNQLVFGFALPSSGLLKSSFPHLSGTFSSQAAPVFKGFLDAPPHLAYRVVQIVLPCICSVVYLLCTVSVEGLRPRLRRQDALEPIFAALALASIGLGLYNGLFVDLYAQGPWYMPLPVLMPTVVLLPLGPRGSPVQRAFRPAVRGALVLIGAATLSTIYFVALQRRPSYHELYATFFFDEAPNIRRHYGANPPKLYCRDDGIVAYATGFPTLSGLGLALDKEGVEAYRQGRLGELAIERGYDHLTSLYYDTLADFDGSEEWINSVTRLYHLGPDPSRYRLRLDYAAPRLGFGILEATPREQAQLPRRAWGVEGSAMSGSGVAPASHHPRDNPDDASRFTW